MDLLHRLSSVVFREVPAVKRISNEQREAIVRQAVATRDAILTTGASLPAWQDVLGDAEQLVRQKPAWSRFIKGTPLENDVPVWIADFALRLLQRDRAACGLQRIRSAIAADRCDGDTEYAAGVNAACRNHLALIDGVIAAGVAPTLKLGWCEHCGEGVTDFCRGKTDACPKGLPQPGTRGVMAIDGGQHG